jgi:transcriptional regulator
MPQENQGRPELIPGTLEMLILKTLSLRPMHGYAIAQHIRRSSDTVLDVEEGSLYPALQRLLVKKWVKAEWGTTKHNRRARIYRLTPAGKEQLGIELSSFERLVNAVALVMKSREVES